MSGFDPTRFVEAETLASPAKVSPPPEPLKLEDIEQGFQGVWDEPRETLATLATLATSAELTHDKPFARELNRLFQLSETARFQGARWERLCKALERFANEAAEPALAAGWEPIELFGVAKGWLAQPYGRVSPAAMGVAVMARGRPCEVIPAGIAIRERDGSINVCRRTHHMSMRAGCALIWETVLPA